MKGFTIFILIVAFFAAVYFGLIHLISKSMHNDQKKDSIETLSTQQQASEKSGDILDRQQDLMRQRQDQMRDLGHR